MEPHTIILAILSAISFFCAWFIPHQLRKRQRAQLEKVLEELKRRAEQNPKGEMKGYRTLGELPADYLDNALDRTADRIIHTILLYLLPQFGEIRDTMWQVMGIFLGIFIAILALINNFGF